MRLVRGVKSLVDQLRSENGVSLLLTAASLVVLLGMAGFAVDLGWIYLNMTQSQKAAEAAALAGVVHMPLPSAVPFSGSEAETVALTISADAGYTNGVNATVTPQEVAGYPTQLQVDVSSGVNTFFMRLFGVDAVNFTRSATAEQLPPLVLGSDEPYMGNDPERGIHVNYWAAINGECELKSNGDPYSTRRHGQNCSGGLNGEFRDPAYYYAVEVPEGAGGGSLTVEIYDGDHWRDNRDDYDSGNIWGTGDRVNPAGSNNWDLDFILYEPDQTPNNWTDNDDIADGGNCFRDFRERNGVSGAVQQWRTLCTVNNASSGIYVMAVSVDGNTRAISAYSLRTRYNGNFSPPGNPVQLYALGALSLDMRDAGATPTFKVAKLEEYYANSNFIVGLYDVGDVYGSDAWLRFGGEASAMDCEVRVNGGAWGGDDSPGSASCELETSGQRYDGDWIELKFDVPVGYTCAGDCWVNVQYSMDAGADVTERTTWTAGVDGQPIHLLP
ncbi:MAG: pilus assembly protein TadG-related protein [Acidimicrobiia bacterium]|nr:pilus assembly protein TadG-related protein [Acidimicrobiia bacterium]